MCNYHHMTKNNEETHRWSYKGKHHLQVLQGFKKQISVMGNEQIHFNGFRIFSESTYAVPKIKE